ncbi:hypothetical protein TW95_gp0854 [Pandoravirus inopinatum]|uniref:Uncharacterized protein n=1 Tax=Pandoravirus inopinatum TaxID=1605721 RepID=A0A0B5IXR6_9VIRU|nr:hypothetical protein TW95_gp0854 [Pandoravirus inopinatum]AJF97588.1 hypothetical protein [Pandoravirus inopinatum]
MRCVTFILYPPLSSFGVRVWDGSRREYYVVKKGGHFGIPIYFSWWPGVSLCGPIVSACWATGSPKRRRLVWQGRCRKTNLWPCAHGSWIAKEWSLFCFF